MFPVIAAVRERLHPVPLLLLVIARQREAGTRASVKLFKSL